MVFRHIGSVHPVLAPDILQPFGDAVMVVAIHRVKVSAGKKRLGTLCDT
jgi:hypothetical protein